jgi:TBC1 domain family member 15
MVESDPPSPTSYYAMSDEDENEYETIGHSTVDKGVKLLFTKSKVGCKLRL